MAHYDGVANAPAAGDDAGGVAAILEAVRALRAGPALRNDVLVVFTDGEETGLLGAQAFLEQDPAAKTVGLVMNFEGRGGSGATQLFQTSVGNGRLIAEAAAAMPHPRASSLSYEIYRRMPNDTDLSPFLRDRYQGLNFAYIGGHTQYHSPTDTPERLNQRSLQHHGEYALPLTRRFGNADLNALRGPDAVYFDVPLLGVVRYPASLALPLALLAAAAVAAFAVWGIRRRRIRGGDAARGLGVLVLSLVLAYALGHFGWKAVLAVHPGYRSLLQGDTYDTGLYLLGFCGLALAVFAGLMRMLAPRASAASLVLPAFALWALLAVASAVMLTGGSYLFTWPLLLALPAAVLAATERPLTPLRALGAALFAVPAIVMVAPLVRMFTVALTPNQLGVPLVLLVLLAALLTPQLRMVQDAAPRVLAPALAAAGVLFLVIGSAAGGFSARHPAANSLVYVMDADSGTARWITFDDAPDAWTRGFLGASPRRTPLPNAWVSGPSQPVLWQIAPALAAVPPAVQVLADSAGASGRRVRLRITSPRGAQRMNLYVATPNVQVSGVAVNGRARPARDNSKEGRPLSSELRSPGRVLTYYAVPAEGVEVAFTVRGSGPVTFRVSDTSYGLPSIPGRAHAARPAGLTGKPFILTDMALVQRNFTLP
jgi:hypothetical protein